MAFYISYSYLNVLFLFFWLSRNGGKDGLPIPTILAIVLPSAFTIMVLLTLVQNEPQPADSFRFDLGTIRSAMDKFSDTNKIDEGGYGDVYKGILSNGLEIAVKRLNSGETAEAFKNEALLISRLQIETF
ncbi:hypothetical protein AAG906_040471 [Vitis piasezkii]